MSNPIYVHNNCVIDSDSVLIAKTLNKDSRSLIVQSLAVEMDILYGSEIVKMSYNQTYCFLHQRVVMVEEDG
jgi:hypothetical protein